MSVQRRMLGLMVRTPILMLGIFLGASPASAAWLDLGKAADFVILALNTNGGTLTINSATSITGNVGVTSGVDTSGAIKKVDTWNGALLSAPTDMAYLVNNAVPSGGVYAPAGYTNLAGGISYSGANYGGMPVQNYLQQAQLDALAAHTFLASQTFTNSAPIGNDTNITISGAAGINYVNLNGTLNLNGDKFTLSGPSSALWVLKYTGATFDFSQSQVEGADASRIVWWFPGDTAIVINKDSTVFNGTILAPNLTTDLIYHNPATFNGEIIANRIDLHSDFNINHVPVPLPAAAWLLISGLAGLGLFGRRKAN